MVLSVFVGIVLFYVLCLVASSSRKTKARIKKYRAGWCVQVKRRFWPFWTNVSFYYDDETLVQQIKNSVVREIILDTYEK